MDSLTQLTLGAAVGEAVLGKKVGNRAMVWGAFGGLLPDFDVFARFFTDEITALAFHRGFMHSIVFSILMAFVFGWLVEWLYRSGTYRKRRYKGFVIFFILSIYTLLILGMNMIFQSSVNHNWRVDWWLGHQLVFFGRPIYQEMNDVQATQAGWILLFFLSIVTHPILDCFTRLAHSYSSRIQTCGYLGTISQ
ncbi:MAG: metal-dependent hydrolase [Saprospiraceae bacterium]